MVIVNVETHKGKWNEEKRSKPEGKNRKKEVDEENHKGKTSGLWSKKEEKQQTKEMDGIVVDKGKDGIHTVAAAADRLLVREWREQRNSLDWLASVGNWEEPEEPGDRNPPKDDSEYSRK
jgi:hypothetical protein